MKTNLIICCKFNKGGEGVGWAQFKHFLILESDIYWL